MKNKHHFSTVFTFLLLFSLSSGALRAGSDALTLESGKKVFSAAGSCVACHQATGLGIPGAFPPLKESPYLVGSDERIIKIVLHGLVGEVEIKGVKYNSAMPAQAKLTDKEVADVLTYVRKEFGGIDAPVAEGTVKKVRDEYSTRTTPWNTTEILGSHPLKP